MLTSLKVGSVDANWAVALGVSALFGLFTAGMAGNTIWLTANNLTTIENLSKVNASYIAVRKNLGGAPERVEERPDSSTSRNLNDPYSEYAMLQTQPGQNPYDLGSSMANLKTILGNSLWDWLLPIRLSPCTNHNSVESEYEFGPVVDRLRQDAGLLPTKKENRRHRRRTKP